jgi:hypothetical protein
LGEKTSKTRRRFIAASSPDFPISRVESALLSAARLAHAPGVDQ